MSIKFRQGCAITHALDILGDKWMLVIIKQMLFEKAETFKDFLECPEAIATNILAAKLKRLEEQGLVTKSKSPQNKKTNYYHLTDKGLASTPIIIEIAIWSHHHLKDLNLSVVNHEAIKAIHLDKEGYCNNVIKQYKRRRRRTII